jgi:hypothetical protein
MMDLANEFRDSAALDEEGDASMAKGGGAAIGATSTWFIMFV